MNEDPATGLWTEEVTENFQSSPGQYDSRTFWIAYRSHVASYGHTSDRISHAYGRGATEAEAIAAAIERYPYVAGKENP